MKKPSALILLSLLVLAVHGLASDLTLWYQQPAGTPIKTPTPGNPGQPLVGLGGGKASPDMNDALPVGNSRMGALIFGLPARERLILNESSLWTGDENPSGDYGKMGAYQVLGNLLINLPGHEQATGYRRDLDLATALAHVSYNLSGTNFQREYLCSHPARVLAAQFTADKKSAHTGWLELVDGHMAKINADGNRLTVAGTLPNGLKYEWQVLLQNQGGTVSAVSDSHSTRLEFKNCDRLTVLVAAGTDYVFDYGRKYHGEDPHARVTAQLNAATGKSFEELRTSHLRDYQQLFNRVSINLGAAAAGQIALPTDLRKAAAVKTTDPGLEALLFQYGRYLLISSSRPGGLPANLQGLWNDNNNPAWHCDYHANINIQMNYWPAEVANLGDCHTPFFDLIQSQLPAWRQATAASSDFKNADGSACRRGFAIRTSHNIHGGMGWKWDNTANAWYCQHLWEHYAFGQDKAYLRTVAYPILKETSEFWEDHLKALPDGRLVVPNGWSPEHGPTEDGVSYSQEIVWDLFNNYVQAAAALGVDKSYAETIAALRDRLVTPRIGKWGQLQEWMTDRDDPNDHHRHTSHLFAVYPGTQISVVKSPDLARAAKVSLDARGSTGDVREWSYAWRTALYARLRDAENAHSMVQHFFGTTCLNLFGNHPPMQMDGNFGMTAGIAEMLVQSQAGEIELLPALPAAWSAGNVSGLRVRGGCEVSIEWLDGKLVKARIKNIASEGPVKLRYGSTVSEIQIKRGKEKTLGPELK